MAKLYGPVAAQVNVYSGTIRADSIEVIDRFDASIFNANPNVQAVAGTISFLYAKFDPAEGFRLTATLADSSQEKLADYGDGQTSEEYGIFSKASNLEILDISTSHLLLRPSTRLKKSINYMGQLTMEMAAMLQRKSPSFMVPFLMGMADMRLN